MPENTELREQVRERYAAAAAAVTAGNTNGDLLTAASPSEHDS